MELDEDSYINILHNLSDADLDRTCQSDKNMIRLCDSRIWPMKVAESLTGDPYGPIPNWSGRYRDLYYSIKGKSRSEVLSWSVEKDHTGVFDYIMGMAPKGDFTGKLLSKLLIKASGNGNLVMVKKLIDAGADINYQTSKGPRKTPIRAAAHNGHLNIVIFLIETGAISDWAITDAVSGNHPDIVLYLLDNKLYDDISLAVALARATRNNNVELAKILLDHGAQPSDIEEIEDDALLETIAGGNLEILKYILQLYPKYKKLSLNLSIEYEKPELVDYLIYIGVVPDIADLKHSLYQLDNKVINLLLKSGLRITDIELGERNQLLQYYANNWLDYSGSNPETKKRYEERKQQFINAMLLLLDNGANINSNGGKPLLNAIENNSPDMIRLLVENGADININNGAPLIKAIKTSDLYLVKILLDLGANINIGGDKMLIKAIERGSSRILRLLLEKGAIPTSGALLFLVETANIRFIEDKYYYSKPSHAYNDSIEIMLRYGLDVNTNYGESLLISVSAGNLDLIEILLKFGADVNVNDSEALVILTSEDHSRIMDIMKNSLGNKNIENLKTIWNENNRQILKKLIYYRLNVNARNGIGLLGAVKNKDVAIAEILLEYGAKITNELFMLSITTSPDMVQLFINFGADVNMENGSPLIKTVEDGNIDILTQLLDNRAKVNAQHGKPLITAVEKTSFQIVKILLDYGANPNIQNTAPLIHAVNWVRISPYQDSDISMIIGLLLTYGADPNARNGKIITIAVEDNDVSSYILELLLNNGGLIKPNYLKIAIGNNDINKVKILVDKGAKITPEDIKLAQGKHAIYKYLKKSS